MGSRQPFSCGGLFKRENFEYVLSLGSLKSAKSVGSLYNPAIQIHISPELLAWLHPSRSSQTASLYLWRDKTIENDWFFLSSVAIPILRKCQKLLIVLTSFDFKFPTSSLLSASLLLELSQSTVIPDRPKMPAMSPYKYNSVLKLIIILNTVYNFYSKGSIDSPVFVESNSIENS